jgi:hypothetical protein
MTKPGEVNTRVTLGIRRPPAANIMFVELVRAFELDAEVSGLGFKV